MRKLILFTLAIGPFVVLAQITSDQVMLNLGIDRDYIVMMKIKPDDPSVEGSPWLFEDWKKCTIETKQQNALDGVLTNYHLINDELFLKLSAGHASVRSDEIIEIVNEDGEVFVRRNVSNPTFLKVLYKSDKYLLLEHIDITEKKPDYNVALDVGNRNLRLIRNSYYYLESDGSLLQLTKKKNRKKLFNSDLEQLENYVKDNKLSWQSPEDLIRIIQEADKGL